MKAKQNKKKLFIAVAAGLVAFLVVLSWTNSTKRAIQNQQRELQEAKLKAAQEMDESQKIGVVIVRKDITAGAKFTPDMLELKKVEPASVPPNSIKSLATVIGTTANENLVMGQVIVDTMLKELLLARPVKIEAGMRGITVPIEGIQGLTSFIIPGNKVDIISTASGEKAKPGMVLQNVKIMAFETGSGSITTGNKPANLPLTGITFLVPANKSTKLIDAMVSGKLQLIARNQDDKEVIAAREASSYSPPPQPSEASPVSSPPSRLSSIPPLPANPGLNINPLGGGFSGLNGPGGLPSPAFPPRKPQKKVEFIQANVKSDITFDN